LHYCCFAAKPVNKHGYIHASYHAAEITFFEYYEYIFFVQMFQVFRWFDLNLAHAWSHRLFEAWLVNSWFEVDLAGDFKAFLSALKAL